MKRSIVQLETALLLACVIITSTACNSAGTSNSASTATTNAANFSTNVDPSAPAAARFSDDELDELFARIALYPDPLLAQIIPAATFVDQLKEAQGALNGSAEDSKIDGQNWDVSVKSVAHYPPVLKMMTEDEGWTTSVGQAYVLQPDDVGKSIQRLRDQAYDAGNLITTPEQNVIETDEMIRIEPAQAQKIYVPQYNAETVYTEPVEQKSDGVSKGTAVAAAAIAFGAGLLIGAWLNNDYDYYGRNVYYHGWNTGPTWVNVNRTYVNVNRGVYVDHNYQTLNLNRNIVHHQSAATYRNRVTLNSSLRRTRVDNARINNINRAPNGRLRTNAGRHVGQDKVNQLDKNRINTGRNPGLDRNRVGSPKINTNDRRPAGTRTAPTRTAPNREAKPAPKQQRSAPAQRSGSGGKRRP